MKDDILWEEKNSTDHKQNLTPNVGNDSVITTTGIEIDSTKVVLCDTTNQKKSGIYKIINKNNGKYYVGSAHSFQRRWEKHRRTLRNGCHANDYLQNSWNKYGEKSFGFFVVEVTELKSLLIREQHYLDIAKNEQEKCYNLNFSAKGGIMSDYARKKLMGRKVSMETRRKISDKKKGTTLTEEHKKKISDKMRNRTRPFTDEHRLRLRESHLNKRHSDESKKKMSMLRMGKSHSEETKKKISESLKKFRRGDLTT